MKKHFSVTDSDGRVHVISTNAVQTVSSWARTPGRCGILIKLRDGDPIETETYDWEGYCSNVLEDDALIAVIP